MVPKIIVQYAENQAILSRLVLFKDQKHYVRAVDLSNDTGYYGFFLKSILIYLKKEQKRYFMLQQSLVLQHILENCMEKIILQLALKVQILW